jgi:transcriptional regulator GlxA family with amidase domain
MVEVLDFAAPYEVFSRTRVEPGVASRMNEDSAPFRVFTVAKTPGVVTAVGGLRVTPDHGFADHPPIDLLVVPGGFGVRPLLEDAAALDWIGRTARAASTVTSVCTGAWLLARTGLLAGKRATSHWAGLDRLGELDPTIQVQRNVRFVDDGVITSAGVTAGLDMSLHVVEKLCGREVADETARYIEYDRR